MPYVTPGSAVANTIIHAALFNDVRDDVVWLRQYLPDPGDGGKLLVSAGGGASGTWTATLPSGIRASDLTSSGNDLLFYGPAYSGGAGSLIAGGFLATSDAFGAVARPALGRIKAQGGFDGGDFSGQAIAGTTITGTILTASTRLESGRVNAVRHDSGAAQDALWVTGPTTLYSGGQAGMLVGALVSTSASYSGITPPQAGVIQGEYLYAPIDAQGLLLSRGGQVYDRPTALGLSAGAGNGSTQMIANDDRLDVIDESDGALLFRLAKANTAPVWKTEVVWHSGNDGAGSTLDADLLDGVHASALLGLSGGTLTGNVDMNNAVLSFLTNAKGVAFSQGGQIYDISTGITYFRAASPTGQPTTAGALDIRSEDGTVSILNINSLNSWPVWKGTGIMWHSDNDGTGSGLDADMVDGSHASAFATSGHTHSYLPLSGGTLTGSATWSNNSQGPVLAQGGKLYDVASPTTETVVDAAGGRLLVTNAGGATVLLADAAATRLAFKGTDLALYSDLPPVLLTLPGSPSADLTLTGSFADFVGATVTLTRDGYWMFLATVFWEKLGTQTNGQSYQTQLVIAGTPQTPLMRENHAIPGGASTMCWVVNASNGQVAKLQCKDTLGAALNKALKDYSSFVAVWLHS